MKRRLFSHKYKIPNNGIYIQGVDGRYYTRSEWNNLPSKPIANGIALATDEQKVLISKVTVQCAWGPLLDVPLLDDLGYSESIFDFNGKENTAKIINKIGNNPNYAAGWCANYLFPDGTRGGYFPSCGQWHQVFSNLSEISACLSTIGAEGFSNMFSCWSSSQYSSMKAWYINRNDRDVWDKDYKSCYVRSFRNLN